MLKIYKAGINSCEGNRSRFFSALLDDLHDWEAKNPKNETAYELATLDVKSKFKKLSTSLLPPKKILDFYSSAETQWEHITKNLDASFEAVNGTINHINNTDIKTPKASIIYGNQVSGKSATALRIGLI